MKNRWLMIIFWLFFTLFFTLAIGTQHFLDVEQASWISALGYSCILLGLVGTIMKK